MAESSAVQRNQGRGGEARCYRLLNRGGAPFTAFYQCFAGEQCLVKRGRLLALRRGEVAVATAQCQTIGFAHSWNNAQAHIDIEIAHKPANNGDLLGILAPEVGDIRSYQLE